ncbi:hypothetical protein J6590_060843 [Homalodisca vitripennis]|nr:hypothetical protein J6590_060843 [Homalodisca vitripennis]
MSGVCPTSGYALSLTINPPAHYSATNGQVLATAPATVKERPQRREPPAEDCLRGPTMKSYCFNATGLQRLKGNKRSSNKIGSPAVNHQSRSPSLTEDQLVAQRSRGTARKLLEWPSSPDPPAQEEIPAANTKVKTVVPIKCSVQVVLVEITVQLNTLIGLLSEVVAICGSPNSW